MPDIPDIGDEFRRLVAAGAPENEKTLLKAIENVSRGGSGIFGRVASIFTSFPADIMRNIKFALLAVLIGTEAENIIQRLITERRLDLNPVPLWLESALSNAMQTSSEAIGAPFFDLLIRDPLGIDLSATQGRPEAESLRFVQRIFGLGTAIDFGVAEVEDLLTAAMGGNAPTGIVKALRGIPWNVGASWATGFFLSTVMNAAAMPGIQEAINRQYRPSKLSPANWLALERMGKIEPGRATQELAGHGYTDENIGHLYDLDASALGISDLQQAYLFGLVGSDEIDKRLHALGFNDADRPIIYELYFKRAETAGAAQLRAVLQRAYLDNQITTDRYRAQLLAINVPPASIDLEIEAADLTKSLQRTHLSVADIKRMHAHALLDDQQSIKRLGELGYTTDDAGDLVREWNLEKSVPKSGLSESRILSYLQAGVLTKQEAVDRLINLGIRAEDAAFLVDHPSAAAPVHAHPVSQATVLAAYNDKLIDYPTALAKLEAHGLTPEDAALALQVNAYKIDRGAKPKLAPKRLSESQILEALKYDLATDAWCVRELELIGYSEDDARILVAIELAKLSGRVPDGWSTLT